MFSVQTPSQTNSLGSSSTALAIFWKLMSCACFAGINGVVRHLTVIQSELDTPVLSTAAVNFFQNIFGTLFLLPVIYTMGLHRLKSQHKTLHLVRVVTAVLGLLLWYEAIKRMPLAQAVSLNFTGPIFTTGAAFFFLKEHVSIVRIGSIGLSLIGAFIISRPDIALLSDTAPSLGFAVIFPITSAIVFAFNKILTRRLAMRGESPESLAIYLLVFMTPVSGLFCLNDMVTGAFYLPTVTQFFWLICAGVLSAMAHLSFAKAYQLAEVTFLMPFGFLKFFMSTCIGYLAFREFPQSIPLIGMGLIFMSAGLSAWHQWRNQSLKITPPNNGLASST
jgi:drug/metabolite transporter (DMT)-like permease